jgi:hypothetical protein
MKNGALWIGLAALAALAVASSGEGAPGKKKRPGNNPFSDDRAQALKAQYIAAVMKSGLPGAEAAAHALERMTPAEIAAMGVPVVGAPYAIASTLIRKVTGKDTVAAIGNTIAGMPGSLFKSPF